MKISINQVVLAMTSAAIVAGGMVFAYWAGAGQKNDLPSTELNSPTIQRLLHADSAATGKSMSLASARVNADYEGLFLLDHKTGNLFCVIISPRTGLEVATFQANVFVGLNLNNVANADLVMTTGFIALGEGGRAGNAKPATCLCYVAEGNSGKVAGYGFQYVQQAVDQSIPQGGQMQLIWQGAVRGPGFGVAPAANPNPPPAGGNPAGGNPAGGNAAGGNAAGGGN